MNASEEITELVLALPETERASLARRLLLSLEPDNFDEDSEAAWAAEIERRMAIVEQGGFRATDWRESIARIRKDLAQGRPS
jgi:putative addiction module component (TIGR02574 family)